MRFSRMNWFWAEKKNNNQWSFSAIGLLTLIWSHTEKTTKYLLWFLAEEETIEELGFAETAADDGDGAVVRGTVILSPEFKQLSLAGHVLSESFKTRPGSKKKTKKYIINPLTCSKSTQPLLWIRSFVLDQRLGQLVPFRFVRATVGSVNAGILGIDLFLRKSGVKQLHQFVAAALLQQLDLKGCFTQLKVRK